MAEVRKWRKMEVLIKLKQTKELKKPHQITSNAFNNPNKKHDFALGGAQQVGIWICPEQSPTYCWSPRTAHPCKYLTPLLRADKHVVSACLKVCNFLGKHHKDAISIHSTLLTNSFSSFWLKKAAVQESSKSSTQLSHSSVLCGSPSLRIYGLTQAHNFPAHRKPRAPAHCNNQ